MAFEDKKNKTKEEFIRPELCGVAGCVEPCDVFVKYKNISRHEVITFPYFDL